MPYGGDAWEPGGESTDPSAPAGIASIQRIAGLHAVVTRELLDNRQQTSDNGPLSLLLTLQQVPEVFPEAFRPYRFRIARSPDCLICRPMDGNLASEDLDAALTEALARLGDG